ncbi:MAG: tail fiber domain-containing protein [Fibrobacteres bacterium]|nr:tail fiber domain-containing protein [Fibrobacterota bacterium]
MTISDAGSITMLPASGNTFVGNSANSGMKFDGSGTYGTSVGSALSAAFLIDTDNNSTNGKFVVGMNSNDPDTATALMTILETGNVGIGTTTPNKLLTVQGDGYFLNNVTAASSTITGTTTTGMLALTSLPTNTAGNALCIVGTAVVTAGGTTCVTSSGRFKQDVEPLSDWKDILDIDVVSFNYKPQYADDVRDAGGKRLGFIAEQVEEVDPRLVQYDAEGNPLSVHFDGITAKTVLAIQEMQKEIDGITGKAQKSEEDPWQWVALFALFGIVIRQQLQIKKLK